MTPFFANKGHHPNITIYPEQDLASVKARKYVINLDELHTELCNQMTKVQKCYQGPADHQLL